MKKVLIVVAMACGTIAGASGEGVRPAREYAKVTFTSPVRVLNNVLMGDYVIEHDNDRMARGGPCTHIYKLSDRSTPVVTFHCTHLRRPATGTRATISLRRYDMGATRGFMLTEFQFAGSTDAHGVPVE